MSGRTYKSKVARFLILKIQNKSLLNTLFEQIEEIEKMIALLKIEWIKMIRTWMTFVLFIVLPVFFSYFFRYGIFIK